MMPKTTTGRGRVGRKHELDRTITVQGREQTVEDLAIERIRTGIPIIEAAAGVGIRRQTIHEWRRRGVRARERHIAGEAVTEDEERMIRFADRCDQAEAEGFSIEWTRLGQLAAGGLVAERTVVTIKTDADGKVVSRSEETQQSRTLPSESAIKFRLGVRYGVRERVELSGPDGGPIPVELAAAALTARLVELGRRSGRPGAVDATSSPLPAAAGSVVAGQRAELRSPDMDVPPPADE